MIFNKMVVSRTGRRIPLQPPANFTAQAGNAQVTLTWTDPENETSGGTTYATWDYTRIVRKTGSSPADENDGELVVESSQKNQYQTTGFVDDGLVNDTQYFYGAFACSTDGVWSEGAFANATPMAGTPLGSLVEGTLIKIQESGAPVEFYVAKQDYEPGLNGAGRVLCVRKDSPRDMTWTDYSYERTEIYSWFRGTYKNRLSQNVINLIGTTKFPYIKKESISFNNYRLENDVLESSVSALSSIELGCTAIFNSSNYQQGSILPIAATLRHYDAQWSRTPMSGTDSPPAILRDGGYTLSTFDYPVLPAFTLPSTALVDQDLNLIETSSAALEVAS